jgi:hypothetical protein
VPTSALNTPAPRQIILFRGSIAVVLGSMLATVLPTALPTELSRVPAAHAALDPCEPEAPPPLSIGPAISEENPYLVSTAGHLTWIAGKDFGVDSDLGLLDIDDGFDLSFRLDAHYRQTNDIDLAGCEWVPIALIDREGGDGLDFTGTFDGDEHSITGMTIAAGSGALANKNRRLGFFSALGPGATVRDLSLEDVTITGVSPLRRVGMLSGFAVNGITVENVSAQGTLDDIQGESGGLIGLFNSFRNEPVDTIISGCSVETTIGLRGSDTTEDIGGLVGIFRGTDSDGAGGLNEIRDCEVAVVITNENSTAREVGGLIGETSASGDGIFIRRVLVTGSLEGRRGLGGIVGSAGSGTEISQSVANVAITAKGTTAREVGGLVGYLGAFGAILNSYSVGTISLTSSSVAEVGGLVGDVGIGAEIRRNYSTTVISNDVAGASSRIAAFFGEATSDPAPLSIANFYLSEANPGLPAVGEGSSLGIAPKTTSQLRNLATFTSEVDNGSWAMVSAAAFGEPSGPPNQVWGIGADVNCGFPFLWWQSAPVISCPNEPSPAVSASSLAPAIHLEVALRVGSLARGSQVTIGGQGLAPGSNARVSVESTPTIVFQRTVGAPGTLSGSAVLPELGPGTHTVYFRATGSDGHQLVLSQRFVVDSQGFVIEVSPVASTVTPALAATGVNSAPAFGWSALALLLILAGSLLQRGRSRRA